MQIYDEKCWVYTSVRLEIVTVSRRWTTYDFLCTFRARNKSSSCKRARRAMECNWSAWMEHVGVMQIFFGASEREIMWSAKCENVLIKHKCLRFSDYKSRKLHRHRVTCCFVHWVRDGRCCSLEHETCWKRLLHAIRVWRFRKRENEERSCEWFVSHTMVNIEVKFDKLWSNVCNGCQELEVEVFIYTMRLAFMSSSFPIIFPSEAFILWLFIKIIFFYCPPKSPRIKSFEIYFVHEDIANELFSVLIMNFILRSHNFRTKFNSSQDWYVCTSIRFPLHQLPAKPDRLLLLMSSHQTKDENKKQFSNFSLSPPHASDSRKD